MKEKNENKQSKNEQPIKLKVLLLDDSEIMLKHVQVLLTNEGFEVLPASTTAKAIEVFHHSHPDAVLADFVLEGGQTGLQYIEAVFALCQHDASRKRPPCAILTMGVLAPSDLTRAEQEGIKVIQKPTRGEEQDFMMSVRIWLDQHFKA